MEKQKHAPKPELQRYAPSVTVFAGGNDSAGRDGECKTGQSAGRLTRLL
ncbi:MAG: hypothetical protein RI826_09970 [Chlorobium phaeovibrioides]|nr:hypothetical protein [Chlorobium phaeovibrioides]